MVFTYITNGVCSRSITVDIDEKNDIVKGVKYVGGCNGNLQGISSLVEGMKVDDIIEKLDSIRCGFKNTSCPAQLAVALKKYKDGSITENK